MVGLPDISARSGRVTELRKLVRIAGRFAISPVSVLDSDGARAVEFKLRRYRISLLIDSVWRRC